MTVDSSPVKAPAGGALYDISRPILSATPPWPGDTSYSLTWNWRQDVGDSVNVSSLSMSVHLGTHIDAPFHFDRNGATAGTLDLAPFWGPAIVIDLTATASVATPIDQGVFANVDFGRTPRILLKTNIWTDYEIFPSAIPTLSLETANWLVSQGAVLLGFDLPSVDALDSTTLPIHHALGAGGVRILESTDLRQVPAGEYELSALPLRLMEADGAPVRAALRRLPSFVG